MATLYELTEQYLTLLSYLEDDVDEEAFAEAMESIEGDFEEKAENYAKLIREMEARAAAFRAESDRMLNNEKILKNNATRVKKALEAAMIATGKRKFKVGVFSFNIQKNPPSLVFDSEDIPEKYLIAQPPKVDNAAIKNALKAGAEFDFAHLEQGEGLRIK